jgi:chemotaxis protein MotB
MSDKPPAAGAPLWMVTFADLMSLLLTLFVLLLTFAEMNIVKYESVIGSLRNALGTARESKLAGVIEIDGSLRRQAAKNVDQSKRPEDQTTPSVSQDIPVREEDLTPEELEERAQEQREERAEKLVTDLQAALEDTPNTDEVAVERRGDEVVLRFPSEIAFPSGQGDITQDFADVVDSLAPIISETKGAIVVSGHTDNVPISGGRFRSNWDLSAARAASVMVRILNTTAIDPARVTIQGYADSRPLVPNDSPENRAKNRRVEVSIIQKANGENGGSRPADEETARDFRENF